MVLGTFTKQPNESIARAIEFGPLLVPGETILTQVVTAKDLADGVDATATLIASPGHTPTTVVARIQGGTANHHYRVRMAATTNAGNVFECEFDVDVRET